MMNNRISIVRTDPSILNEAMIKSFWLEGSFLTRPKKRLKVPGPMIIPANNKLGMI